MTASLGLVEELLIKQKVRKWEVPRNASFKVNCDASWSKDHNGVKVGVGVVIRDHRCEFYAMQSKTCINVLSMEVVSSGI